MSFLDVVRNGLAKDGGLYVPETIPTFSSSEWEDLVRICREPGGYLEICFRVLRQFISTEEISDATLRDIVNRAYSAWESNGGVVRIVRKEFFFLELFHGPTRSFKDIALQLLGEFISLASKGLTVIGATSGDTGAAALSGVKGRQNLNCLILYPQGRVSDIQERQMLEYNKFPGLRAVGIKNAVFDDCQEMVKKLLSRRNFQVTSVNSINWARILAQIVYYVYTSAFMQNELGSSAPVTFSVPTGNFGNILAGFYARKMRAGVGTFICASNKNDVLTRFFHNGIYRKTAVTPSLSPSMDISISSNLERYLFEVFRETHIDRQASARVSGQFQSLKENSFFQVSESELSMLTRNFQAVSVSDEEALKGIADVFKRFNGKLLCPHSAVAWVGISSASTPSDPICIVETAHIGKFSDYVSAAVEKSFEAGPETDSLLSALACCVPKDLEILSHLDVNKWRIILPNNFEAVECYLKNVFWR